MSLTPLTWKMHMNATDNNEEHGHGDAGGFWEEYLQLLTDPAHLAYEVTFTILFDFIIIAFLYGVLVKKIIIPRLRKSIHAEIHAEHGDDADHCEVIPTTDQQGKVAS